MFGIISKLKNRKGFTLIELIVVLAVLAIIMAIAVPRFLGVQDDAKDKADAATTQMVQKAAELYFAKNNVDNGTVTVAKLKTDGLLDDAKWNKAANAIVSVTIVTTGTSVDITLNK